MELKQAIIDCRGYLNAIETFGSIDSRKCNKLYEPVKTVLQELERLQKENEELKKLLEEIILGGEEKEKKPYRVGLIAGADREYKRWQNKIRELISKIDVDIERNKNREIMYKEEKGTSEYVCKMISYMPETVKSFLQDLLKEE